MSKYRVPVVFSMKGYVEIEANSSDDAFERAESMLSELPLPETSEYLEDSMEVDTEGFCYDEAGKTHWLNENADVRVFQGSEDEMGLWDSKLKVVLEYIGEGRFGDYNEENPEDVPYMRFSVFYRNSEDALHWEEVEDASYCTQIRLDAPKQAKLEKLQVIWERYREVIDEYPEVSVKKLGEELSWISA